MKRVILLVSLFVLAFPACTKKESPEQKFWAWFQANSERLHEFEKDQNMIFAELDAAMDKVNKDLLFEFGPDEGGVREFTAPSRCQPFRNLLENKVFRSGWHLFC